MRKARIVALFIDIKYKIANINWSLGSLDFLELSFECLDLGLQLLVLGHKLKVLFKIILEYTLFRKPDERTLLIIEEREVCLLDIVQFIEFFEIPWIVFVYCVVFYNLKAFFGNPSVSLLGFLQSFQESWINFRKLLGKLFLLFFDSLFVLFNLLFNFNDLLRLLSFW